MKRLDPNILEDVFHAHAPRLVLYARQWLDSAGAEDAVQEVFMRLAGQRRLPEEVRAWLFRSVRNAAISEIRARQRRRQREDRVAGDAPPWFTAHPDDRLDAAAAEAALAKLPIEQREILVLRIWGELSFQEISSTVERPISSVFVEYRDALASLRQLLEAPCPRT